MKKILIINGHPDKESFNDALINAYCKGLNASSSEVSIIVIRDLQFNPNLQYGYRKRTELEPDLLAAIEKIKSADHIVWVFPVWWFGSPAIMKGFIDRTFLPGITFEAIPGKPFIRKLLVGKTAHLIVTADTPRWYDILFMGSPALNQLKKGTLELCGIKVKKVSYIAPMKDCSAAFREKWLTRVERLAAALK
ncbi:NAD(P)H-dependent oxidoreductase [Chitinophaga sp. Hz27]|uniref:NAD(P)H-dependent oxidoreductase n=1 Tax=Chitinophaga sp. Hz27 TaxID=3347169 RepID=UPI0035DCEABF